MRNILAIAKSQEKHGKIPKISMTAFEVYYHEQISSRKLSNILKFYTWAFRHLPSHEWGIIWGRKRLQMLRRPWMRLLT